MRKSYYRDYQLPNQFQMEEPYDVFREYGARYYRCTWLDALQNGEKGNVTIDILIKSGEALPIGQWLGGPSEFLEVDFDHDGKTELIFYFRPNYDYARPVHYFLIEKGDERVYNATYENALFDRVQNDDYIIRRKIYEGLEVTGVLKYRVVNGEKQIYIDAGEDTDKFTID